MGPKEWPILKKYGLTCAMVSGAGMGIGKGFNRVENHDKLVAELRGADPQGRRGRHSQNVICISGNREGLDDEQGIKNCAVGPQAADEAGRSRRRSTS